MGRSVMRYDPELVVVAERLKSVARFFAVTVALGRTAPVVSVTSPAMSPVIFWATRELLTRITASIASRHENRKCRITPSQRDSNSFITQPTTDSGKVYSQAVSCQ